MQTHGRWNYLQMYFWLRLGVGTYSSPKATWGRGKSHCRLPLAVRCLIQKEVAKATVYLSWLDLVMHMGFMVNQDQLSERDGKGSFFSLHSFDYSACTSESRNSEFTLVLVSDTSCSYLDPWGELQSSAGTTHANCPLNSYKEIRYLASTHSAPTKITSAPTCSLQGNWSGALSCTCRFWWGGKIQPLSCTPVKRRGKCSAQSLTAISVGSEQQEELVHSVGMAVGFGSEGRRRTWWEGSTHSKEKPNCAQSTLAARRKHEVQWDAHRTVFPAGLCGCSYQHISQFTSEFKTAALQQRTTTCERRQISWVRYAG